MTTPTELDYEICAYASGVGALVDVHTLCGVPPQSTYYPGAQVYWKADGTRYFDGTIRCVWKFTAIPKQGVGALRAICSGASAQVYITTRTDTYDEDTEVYEEEFATFSATMHWPLEAHEKRKSRGLYQDLEIEFTELVEVTS